MTEMRSYCNDGKGTKEQVGKVNQERTPTQGTAFWDRAKPIWVPIPAQTLESKLFTVSELSPRVEKVGESGKKFFKCTLFGYYILYLKFHHQFLEVHVCVCVFASVCDCTCGQSSFICIALAYNTSLWSNSHCLRTLERASSPAGLPFHHLSNADNKNSCFSSRVHTVEENNQGGVLESIATNQVYC